MAATESAIRAIIQPSSGSGRQGVMMMGFLKWLISGGILLCLTGVTFTSAVLGIIVFSLLILISSPIWLPIGIILLISIIGFLWFCGMGAALMFGLPWMYKYLRGTRPLARIG
ncbi:hypothetical protein MKW94_020271 [Papaver nudicaule]|uniref:Uncharacterized protein n=1 Tax=Papaver nudicaule TaxID=74823 RepID=A0AA41RW94_PAPNU|nr:hypothetical protein [Papaver nudicaule]